MVREPVAGAKSEAKALPATGSGRLSVHESLDGLSSVDSTETMEEDIKNGIARLGFAPGGPQVKVPMAIPEKEVLTTPMTNTTAPSVVA
ncbi:hypothetical protein FH972_009483 [Carpinus fangiana]|uniref:Uncharacterized protein n=1 Tax=Carpinus fangiana TaxID=176857 RepID=A0A660KMC8_9ROSI|nr:hypothetical protein FH972_009483 [Carpinus fangiana]